jgi:hypothetical protein
MNQHILRQARWECASATEFNFEIPLVKQESPVLTRPSAKLSATMREVLKRRSDTRFPRLFVARSKIHGLGLFAGEDIEWGRRIAKFQGQPLSIQEVKRRQKFYDSIGFSCLMQFSDGRGIDGVIGGNESRFINHSREPNVGALRESEWRIIFYSLDDIAEGEELTFNYGFDPNRIYSHLASENELVIDSAQRKPRSRVHRKNGAQVT